jgi:hypothetical protein
VLLEFIMQLQKRSHEKIELMKFARMSLMTPVRLRIVYPNTTVRKLNRSQDTPVPGTSIAILFTNFC